MSRTTRIVVVVIVIVAAALAVRWFGSGSAVQLMRSMHGH